MPTSKECPRRQQRLESTPLIGESGGENLSDYPLEIAAQR